MKSFKKVSNRKKKKCLCQDGRMTEDGKTFPCPHCCPDAAKQWGLEQITRSIIPHNLLPGWMR